MGIRLQLDLKLLNDIASKFGGAKKQIRRALCCALERARLIAYTSLWLSHLEYASCAQNPFTGTKIEALEIVQSGDDDLWIAGEEGCYGS